LSRNLATRFLGDLLAVLSRDLVARLPWNLLTALPWDFLAVFFGYLLTSLPRNL